MTTDFKKQGKKNRVSGADFERRVRADLEKQGWIVFKNNNNVELVDERISSKYGKRIGKLIPAKHKFNPFNKVLAMGTGFPDFLCIKYITPQKILEMMKNDNMSNM